MFRYFLKGNYKGYLKELQKVKKKTGKKVIILLIDTILSTTILRSGMQDYLNYRFYEKKWIERKKYITIGYSRKFYKEMSGEKYTSFISNKINFLKNYQEFIKRDFYNPETGYKKLCLFLKKNNTFIKKPTRGVGGGKIYKLKTKEIKNKKEFYNTLIKEKAHLEEYIIQNKIWGKINPYSINTLRVMTFVLNSNVDIFMIMARIGSNKNIVDNFHKGGIGVLVDRENGCLIGPAYNKNLESFDYHPETKIKIDGYKIPYFKEIKEIVTKAALINENIHIVGWDVAITEKGPLIIEGNRTPGWDLGQVLLNKGCKNIAEEFRKKIKT